ncbi:MAG TPA: DNA polymerase [Dermatophilaceae bacterium]|nr:DNA polymerase I [Actinomycetales bacterium]HMT31475.1 DNA polymerase [Dermatophilaceae bacterium]HMT89385.1 DNA polymerase [Dermatophilaceae bacterium]
MPPTARLPGPRVALAVAGDRAAYRWEGRTYAGELTALLPALTALERDHAPRWVVANAGSALVALAAHEVRVTRCWDVAEAHRLLAGGWRADLGAAWAQVRGEPWPALPADPPRRQEATLFDVATSVPPGQRTTADPDRPSHHPPPSSEAVPRISDPVQIADLADFLDVLADLQYQRLAAIGARSVATAYSESAAAVLALELERDGLPIDRDRAEALIAAAAGPRPRDAAEAAAVRAERDERVLRHAPGRRADLRNPADVQALLAAVGVSVPSTRAWVLEPYRRSHPLVAALLDWRKDERISTTYGYRWLDEHVGPDNRLRGPWTACDGAAGRMTARNGLHNLPQPLRPAVAAEPGFVFVRADLGQIEPRVLAALSGDPAFATASRADDLYAPVAETLGVPRATAKIAVLAAMYGQRSGAAGAALRGLERAFPAAMTVLDEAYAAGLQGRSLRTYGGRLIPLHSDPSESSAAAAARGRYARNALVQGSAAELFKAWAATVRHEVRPMGGQIVLCLHDELLVHVPQESADAAVAILHRALSDSARRWVGSEAVRFIADVSVVRRWDEAKPGS